MPLPETNCTGPKWSKKMKGPTICRLPCGSARRTANPSPRSRVRGTMTRSSASHDMGSPSTGSFEGCQLMVDYFFIAAILTGFDDPVAAPAHRRDGLFAVIVRYRRYLIWKQGRAMVSPIKLGR